MKILRLPICKRWFNMIASGEKKEEYRNAGVYWTARLTAGPYDYVEFRNGYQLDSPRILVEYLGFRLGRGKKKWGAPDYAVYVIKLGTIKGDGPHA